MQRFEFIETRRFGEKRNNLKYKIPLWPDVKGPVRIELAYFGILLSPPTQSVGGSKFQQNFKSRKFCIFSE